MKKQTQPLKGFRDFLPAEAKKRLWLKNKLREIFESWGFEPLITPTLEYLEIFEGEIGEDEKLFYKFKDPGDRDVALRYDQTVPRCRAIGNYQNDIVFPFKSYQIQSVFRAEKPQSGRYREFVSCDADIFGVESDYADAEVIALSLDIYRQLGFQKAVVYINDRKLLKELPYEAVVSIDKLDKIGEEGVIEEMTKKGISKDQARQYLDFVLNLKPNSTIQTILDYLEAMGFPKDWYEFAPTIARSFSYSDGPIWEVKIPEYDSGSVLGGERFDKLTEKFAGRKINGTGFGLGLDRTLEAIEKLNLYPKSQEKEVLMISILSEKELSYALEVADKLRSKGLNVTVYPDPAAKLSKQFKYADRKGISRVIIVGEEEKNKGVLTMKDMKTGEQKMMKVEEFC